MENKLREKMLRGEKVVGTFTHIGGGVAIECLGIAGMDFVVIDFFDLSTDMGMPGNFTHPDFLAARQRILKACKDAGKFAWIFSPSSEAAIQNFADGFDGAAVSMDTVVYTSSFKKMVDEIRNR